MRNLRGWLIRGGARIGLVCALAGCALGGCVLGAVELAHADVGPSCSCRVGADHDAERGLMLGLLGGALGLALWLSRSRGK